jgi:hypothetical protein
MNYCVNIIACFTRNNVNTLVQLDVGSEGTSEQRPVDQLAVV